ncbi:MAG: hypothetical protein GY866_05285 [Proteobacteria bacterium]|nr:hypothetical protein [Pseudomonadota bacterium]
MRIRINENLDDSWNEGRVEQLHSDIVSDFLRCDDEHGEKATVEYVKFLNFKGLDNYNYPYYMNLFLHENEEVISAFLADGNVLNSLKKLQRNHRLITLCFELLIRFKPGRVYEKILETLLIILNSNYRSADAGFKIFAMTSDHLFCIAKYLDKNKPQTNKINRIILDILADLGELKTIDAKDQYDRGLYEIGMRANKIRNVYFDTRVSMDEIMPYPLLAGTNT